VNMRLHHVGFVVPNIGDHLAGSIWLRHGDIVTDPLQGARLCMAALPGQPPVAEFIEPLGPESRVWNALQRAPGPHHLCFTVPTMAEGDEVIKARRLLPVTPWEPAPLFAGHTVRFAYSRRRELLEFLCEAPPA
jgi:catechol 2,3-dioxygenase-like lactoylglutathione lyase family enzyme